MLLRRMCLHLVCVAAGSIAPLWPQATQPDLPTDATALMTLAHEKNGLGAKGIHPWHVKGTFRIMTREGQPEDEGTYEEWWISPAQYKSSFTTKNFTQTDYADGKRLFREGSQDWASGWEMLLRANLLDPVPDPAQLKDFILDKHTQPAGQISLECVAITFPLLSGTKVSGDYFPTACFDSKIPVLRLYSSGSTMRAVFDRFALFQSHYVPREVRYYFSGKLAVEVSLDTIEALKEPADSLLTPPPSANPVDLSAIVVTEANTSHYPGVLKKTFPSYPLQAKNMQVQGTIMIRGTVGPDGHPTNLKVISGPEILRQAALESIQQWIYRPFLVMGEPRAFQVDFKVIFTLG